MIMKKESKAHKEFGKYLPNIGHHKLSSDNALHQSLEEFRQNKNGEDPSKELFKYECTK